MKKLFLVDAYALIFKYYYAFMGRPMRNRAGMNTSVVFGFTKFLRDIQKREHPDLLGVAFDPKGGSFRREIFPEYKANRAETPEDILLSVPYVKRIVEAMCIPVLEVPGYEADDVIGTLAYKGVEAGYDVFMVTPDKDYGQLLQVQVWQHIFQECVQQFSRCRLSESQCQGRIWRVSTHSIQSFRCRPESRLPQLRSMAEQTQLFWLQRFLQPQILSFFRN